MQIHTHTYESLNIKQHDKEPFVGSWDHFIDLIFTGPKLDIPESTIFQDFYMGLNKDDAQRLDSASKRYFLGLSTSKAMVIIDRFCDCTPSTSIFPKQNEEVSIAELQSFQSQNSAINHVSSIPQNPQKEESILHFKSPPCEFKGNIIDFGRAINSRPRKRPLDKHIQKFLMEESLRKHPYSHIGHWEEPKDDMSSDAIVGEQTYLGDNPILPFYAYTR
jgi:hypothetical protein